MTPSDANKDITDKLIQMGKIINIAVEDHLIISPTTYISFSTMGLMDTLKESLTYMPAYLLIEKIRKEEPALRDEAIEKGAQKYKIAIVHNLLENGLSIKQIAKILDLDSNEVQQIGKRRKKTSK